jgi:hypothetical protein
MTDFLVVCQFSLSFFRLPLRCVGFRIVSSEALDYDCFLKVLSTSRVFADFVSLSLPVGADRDSLSAEPWILYRNFRPGQAIGSLVFLPPSVAPVAAFAFAVIS